MLKLFLNLSLFLTSSLFSLGLGTYYIFVQNHFNLAIHSFKCAVLTSCVECVCVETLLSSLDMKMRIFYDAHNAVSM